MAELRIRIELQRPRKGIELGKLKVLAEEAQKFLRMVAEDVGVDPSAGTWVAENFYNQGIGFDCDYQFTEVDQPQVSSYLHAVDLISRVGLDELESVRGVRPLTILQSATLAAIADDDEVVRVGLRPGAADIEWRPLPKPRAQTIIEHYRSWVEYRGMLQGVIHSLFKEASPPYFTLRDFASRELIRCEFRASEWPSVHDALKRKDGVVLVAGWVKARRINKAIELVKVDKIEGTRPMDADRLRALFGSAPGWTGDGC